MYKKVFTLIAALVTFSFGNAQAEVQSFSQEYVCDGYRAGQRVSVYDMERPIIGYVSSVSRWHTFERGEVFLGYDVPYYFTWDGIEWTFNFLPKFGDLIEIPYDYELWTTVEVSKFGISVLGMFNHGFNAPNCWGRQNVRAFGNF